MSFNVRNLAIIDLYGARGTTRRRRLVHAEFTLGFGGGVTLGGYVLAHGGLRAWLIGLWLIGIGLNYLPLTIYAFRFRRLPRLSAEVAAIHDLHGQIRYYSLAQARLLIPALVAVLALRQAVNHREVV